MTYDPMREAARQEVEAARYLRALEDPTLPRMPWPDLDAIVGPMLPGFLIAIGGRPKAGKTSILLNIASDCANQGTPFAFVTTEMRAAQCKAVWAATRLGKWQGLGHRLADGVRFEVRQEMRRLTSECAESVMFRDMPQITPEALVKAVEEAHTHGAKVFFFDYFQRMKTVGASRWEQLEAAIVETKEVAKRAEMILMMAAQLHPGKDRDPVSKYLLPTDGDWRGGPGPQQESDVALQTWRPLAQGLERGALAKYRRGELKATDISAQNTMGVRCSGHRWIHESNDSTTRLHIHAGKVGNLVRDPSPDLESFESRYDL